MLVQTTVFYLNYCNDLRSVLSALAPGSFSCSLFLSSLLRTFNDFLSKVCPLSCQSFLKSHFPLLFPTLTLDTLALLFLKISMDLSTSGTCLLQGLGASRSLCLIIPCDVHAHAGNWGAGWESTCPGHVVSRWLTPELLLITLLGSSCCKEEPDEGAVWTAD